MAARDVIFIGVIIFTMALSLFVIKFAADTMIDSLVAVPALNQTQGTVDSFLAAKTSVTDRFDYIIFSIFMAIVLLTIITSWFVAGNPIFTFIFIIVSILGVVFSTIMSNIWQDVTQSSAFGTLLSSFPITNHILSFLPLYITIIAFIALVVQFAKPAFRGDMP